MTTPDLASFWPPDALRLRTPRLTLSPLRESDFAPLLQAVLAGIHDPAAMPFSQPWTDQPREELIPTALQYWWSIRGAVSENNWTLAWVVRAGDEVIGVQETNADHFTITRTVGTGSWLTRSAHGKGFGTEMRTAVVMFAFDVLGALRAETEVFADNPASLGVNRRLGYRPNGSKMLMRRPGEAAKNLQFVLAPNDFVRPEWPLEVDGVGTQVLELLGATVTAAPQ